MINWLNKIKYYVLAVLGISAVAIGSQFGADTKSVDQIVAEKPELAIKAELKDIVFDTEKTEEGKTVKEYYFKTDEDFGLEAVNKNEEFSLAFKTGDNSQRIYGRPEAWNDNGVTKKLGDATTTLEVWNEKTKTSFWGRLLGKDVYADSLSGFSPESGDGYAYDYGDTSWANTRGEDIAADFSYTATADNMHAGTTGGAYYLCRMFYPFNTTSIPAGATIASSSFFVMVDKTAPSTSRTFSVIQTTQAATSSVAAADFDNLTLNTPDEGSSRISYNDFGDLAYTEFVLNATGLTWIKDAGDASVCGDLSPGWTCLGIRNGDKDIDNSQPADLLYAQWQFSNYTGTTRDPFLEVQYTEGGAPPAEEETTKRQDIIIF